MFSLTDIQMACQMGLRRLFADKRRCAVADRMTLGVVLVTVFTLLVFDLVLRRLHNAKRKKKGSDYGVF